MTIEDLVPDSALVARLEAVQAAIDSLTGLTVTRKHLPLGALTELQDHIGGVVEEVKAAAQPDDEINAKYRSRMRNECFPTYSGVWFYPFDPKPEEVRHTDIVWSLSHACRWRGHVLRLISTAEHSIKVAAIVEHLVTEEVRNGDLSSDMIALATLHALLHDGHEAYSGDQIRPMKHRMCDVFGTPWERIEGKIQDAILEAYGLGPMPPEVAAIIKQADDWMLYCESIKLKPDVDWSISGPFRVPPGDVVSIGRVKTEEVPVKGVRELFDSEIRRLVKVIGARLPDDKTLTPSQSVSRQGAAQNLADVMAVVPIPGERPNPPATTPKPEGEFLPNLSRPARGDEVSTSAWQSAVRSSEVEIPSELLNEPEFQGD